MKKFFLLAIFLLGGCTSIGHQPAPSDWPRLTIVEHRMKTAEVFQKCYQTIPLGLKLLGAIPEGCAFIDFAAMRCDIYIHVDFGPRDRVHEHELEHCAGRDHFGASTLADAWEAWKVQNLSGAARYYYVRHDGQTVAAALRQPVGSPTVFDNFKRPITFDPPKRQRTIFD